MVTLKNKTCSGLKSILSGHPITPALMPGLRKPLRVRALAQNYDRTTFLCVTLQIDRDKLCKFFIFFLLHRGNPDKTQRGTEL
jgi:hypothetical protein